jgi:hypothetical protein
MNQNKQMADVAGKAERAYVYSGFSRPDHNILGLPKQLANPPYDTGKVKIGLTYQPRQDNGLSADAQRLQLALLDTKDRQQERTERLFLRCLYVIGLIGLFIVIATR